MSQNTGRLSREAMYYSKAGDGKTICALCPRMCALMPGSTGACMARMNEAGTLYSMNYAKVTSVSLDPIEKKPLRRFYPGSMILSVGSFGCNFSCPYCQNYGISQSTPQTLAMAPGALVRRALAAKNSGNIGLAFTYNEPIVCYEFVRETSEQAYDGGLLNVLVTNGYINPEPLNELLPFIAALNIDLKGSEAFYKEMCGGNRRTVLRSIEAAYAAGCHVEVTNLLVTGWNDNQSAVKEIAGAIASISDEIPLHLSRFFPRHNMQGVLPTDSEFVHDAVKIAGAHLKYVYPGNV